MGKYSFGIAMKMKPSMVRQIDELAQRIEGDRSEIIREAVQEYINRHNGQKSTDSATVAG
jgi:metal-responsive CopG/Arc/MetJ family transcriptional regulator